MGLTFLKMHGLGNDYVYVDLFAQALDLDWPALARAMSDRHFGVGSDGLILIGPGTAANVSMRIFNADGSEAEMCGNGLRCTAKYAYEHGLLAESLTCPPVRFESVIGLATESAGRWHGADIQTGAGVLTVAVHATDADLVDRVCVDMGKPILDGRAIPTTLTGPNVIAHPLCLSAGTVNVTCVSMGNPHAVIFTDDLEQIDLARLGPAIERHEMFPERTNVHVAQRQGADRVAVLTWERGSGRTLACGTGACAVVVAGALENRLGRCVTVELPGGELTITYSSQDDHVYMLGPATEVFTGTWPDIETFAD